MNSSGFTGKFGSGSTATSNSQSSMLSFVSFVSFVRFHMRAWVAHDGQTRPSCGVEWSCGWTYLVGGGWRISVQDFGNESVVLDEGVIVERLRPFDPEFDKRQRNPVVQFLDNSGFNAKLRGHYQYYGSPTNYCSIWQFFRRVRRIWREWLSRRTRGQPLTWERYAEILRQWPLLRPRITQAWAGAGSRV